MIRLGLHIVILVAGVGLFQTSAVTNNIFFQAVTGKRTELLASRSEPTVVRKKIYPEETTEETPEDGDQEPAIVRKKVPPLPAAPEEASTAQPPKPTASEAAGDPKRPSSARGEEFSQTVGSGPAKAETAPAAVPDGSPTQPEGLESGLHWTPLPEDAPRPVETTLETGRSAVGAAETILPEESRARPYSLMLASCRLKDSAHSVVAVHRKKGLSPFIVKVELANGDVWWRIMAGNYENWQEAARAREEYALPDSVVIKTPYTNLIATFSSEQRARATVDRLEELGYLPYLMIGEKSVRLVVGAFETRAGAEKQQDELESRGIPSQIIAR